jgi:DNA recombination protein RmuC
MDMMIYLITGLLAGIALGYLAAAFFAKSSQQASQTKLQDDLTAAVARQAALQAEINLKDQSLQAMKQEASYDKRTILELNQLLSKAQTDLYHMEQRFVSQKTDLEGLQQKMLEQFENLSNKVLRENSLTFNSASSQQIETILKPLKEKITAFEANVQNTFEKNLAESASLKEQIAMLAELNRRIELDANNLTKAIKGDNKKLQGNWGEMLLESLLEKSGLEKELQYKTQSTYTNDEEGINRPDVVVYLPDEKHLVIDSKVSLSAYTDYCNCGEEDGLSFLNAHCLALRNHVKQLSAKRYEQLNGINSPDYVLMFVPVEPAFNLAMQHDSKLFMDALDKNIVLVTSSTLLATLRTVASIWKQENQKRNVIEIAEESGKLYDKFVNLLEDLRRVGASLSGTQKSFDDAMNKLSEGKGNLISRVEKIKRLGAKATKAIDSHLLQEAEE